MKTLDGAALIQAQLKKLHSRYPADSLTPRDVVTTIPMEYDEAKIQSVNAAITKTIYQHAEEFIKNLPPKTIGFTPIKNPLTYADKKATEEAETKKITQSVVDAAYAAISAEK